MATRKMRVVFVEDDREDVDDVMLMLESSLYIDVVHRFQYSDVTEEDISGADLFVLDVITGGTDTAFCKFIRRLRSFERPFIAYTKKGHHGTVLPAPGMKEVRLREAIFKNGGLGMVRKWPKPKIETDITRPDLGLDLVERIFTYYWARRGILNT